MKKLDRISPKNFEYIWNQLNNFKLNYHSPTNEVYTIHYVIVLNKN
jgi:hypothetical protein